MTPDDDTTTAVDDVQADAEAESEADFGSGFSGKSAADKTAVKERPAPAETQQTEVRPEPEKFVQISEKDWAEVQAAARRTASYDGQFSKLFGTTGSIQSNIQKMLNEQRASGQPAPAAARKFEISKTAFAKMERDFPELAQQTREALQEVFSGFPVGAADVDPAKLESMLEAYTAKREIAFLEADHPDWRDIVGAVDVTTTQPDPNNPFRRWLATKDASYQRRINGSQSADVIGSAITTFRKETAAPAKPGATPRDDARAERIRGAVQQRGDGGGAARATTEDDEFLSGFASR